MTKRDLDLVADVLRHLRYQYQGVSPVTPTSMLAEVVVTLGDALADANPRFDMRKWHEACAVTEVRS